MTAGEAGVGRVTADTLPAWWWLEESQGVDVCQLMLTVKVYLSVASS